MSERQGALARASWCDRQAGLSWREPSTSLQGLSDEANRGDMSEFELWSLVAYYLQLGLIGFGLLLMTWTGRRRDKQLDLQHRETMARFERQEKVLEEIGVGIREQSAGIREQSAGLRAVAEGIREQSASLREVVELSRAQRAEQREQSAGIRALLERGQQA